MNIKKAIKDVQSYCIKKNDYINFEETSKILEILKENNNNIDIESIINNIKYKKYFDLYLEIWQMKMVIIKIILKLVNMN